MRARKHTRVTVDAPVYTVTLKSRKQNPGPRPASSRKRPMHTEPYTTPCSAAHGRIAGRIKMQPKPRGR